MPHSEPSPDDPSPGREFATTHWSVVLRAGQEHSLSSAAALETLCRAYWYPLYAFVRRHGHSPPEAQDLTQEFFARLLAKNWVARADPARGSFRSFLLAMLKHFLANEWDQTRCLKRGGGHEFIEIDAAATAEERYALEPPDLDTPERLYDRRWALILLTRAQDRLRAEMMAGSQRERFEALEPTLTGERTALPYQELAARFGVTEAAVKSMVRRLRLRFRDLLREEVAQTIDCAKDVDAELASLFATLGN